MKLVITTAAATLLLARCGSYKGYEIWRKGTCNSVADADEKARCLEEATRSENEYRQDVENATNN